MAAGGRQLERDCGGCVIIPSPLVRFGRWTTIQVERGSYHPVMTVNLLPSSCLGSDFSRQGPWWSDRACGVAVSTVKSRYHRGCGEEKLEHE